MKRKRNIFILIVIALLVIGSILFITIKSQNTPIIKEEIKDEIKDEIKEISKQPIQTTSFFSMNIQTIIFAFIMLLFCIIFHYVIAIKKTPLIDHQDIENKIM